MSTSASEVTIILSETSADNMILLWNSDQNYSSRCGGEWGLEVNRMGGRGSKMWSLMTDMEIQHRTI